MPITILTNFDQRVKAARRFAKMHGYSGRPGGWIYNDAGRPVAQGWSEFYSRREMHPDMQIIAQNILARARA